MAESGPEFRPLTPKLGLCPLLQAACQSWGPKSWGWKAQPSSDVAPQVSQSQRPFRSSPTSCTPPLAFCTPNTFLSALIPHILPPRLCPCAATCNCLPSLLQLMESCSIPPVSNSKVMSSGISSPPQGRFHTPSSLCCHTYTFCVSLPTGPQAPRGQSKTLLKASEPLYSILSMLPVCLLQAPVKQ